MSIIKNHIKGGGEADLPPFYNYKIGQSLRLDSGSSAHLTRTFTSSGSTKSWTLSFWIKLTDFDWGSIFGCGSNANNNDNIYYDGSNEGIYYRMETSNTARAQLTTLAEYRDPSAWYHIVVSYGSDNSIEADRLVMYVNGVQQELDNNNPIELDRDSIINTSTNHNIGIDYTNDPLDCYLAEYIFIDGQTLSSDAFGEFKNGVWIPKTYEGTYGTNGFHLDFADSSDIGKDISGNNNDWVANNIASTDVMLDSPTNNFCTFNPIDVRGNGPATLSQGNLRRDDSSSTGRSTYGTFHVTSGKWYWESYVISRDELNFFARFETTESSWGWRANGTVQSGLTGSSIFSYANNDILGVFLDYDNEEVEFFKNGVSQGVYIFNTSHNGLPITPSVADATSDASGGDCAINFGQDSSFAGLTTAGGFTDSNGNGDFKYEPPVGALALCTDNLPETVFSPSTGYAQREVVPISYFVDSSVRLNDDDVASLSKLFDVSGDRRTWTFSTWMKRGNLVRGRLLGSDDGATSQNSLYIRIEDSGAILLNGELGNTNGPNVETQNTFNEVDKYYHVVVTFDSTQVTPEDRVKIYVDGVDQLLTHTTSPSLNVEHWINHTSNTHALGGSSTGSQRFDGYLAETHFIDGETLTADDFGEVRNGEWIPKQYTDGYGTNGFYLNFADDQDIGGDLSGNGNDWTTVNLNDHDVVEDGPSDNLTTLDSTLYRTSVSAPTFSEGNLEQKGTTTSQTWTGGNLKVSSGKWYWEALATTVGNAAHAYGVSTRSSIEAASNTDSIYYKTQSGGTIVKDGATAQTSLGSIVSGEVVGIYLNMDDREITFYKEGTQVGVTESLVDGVAAYLPMFTFTSADTQNVNFGQDSSFAGNKTTGSANATDAKGKGDFYYTPPVGALALCESNIPDTTVEPLGLAEDNFDILLYEGNGANNPITGTSFQPDMTWMKTRSAAFGHHVADSIRGVGNHIFPHLTNAEYPYVNTGDGLTSFDSNGITVHGNMEVNYTGQSYVAWNWKMGGSGVINNDGSVQSIVSANVEAGQSVVAITGDGGTPSTVGHGLSEPLEFIIGKSRDSSNDWPVYHKDIGATAFVELNTTIASLVSINRWGDTEPTNEVFTIYHGGSASTNVTNEDYIFYCFHSVEGYSKFGSYVGNGSTDGPFIYLGFRARYLLIKTSASGSWKIWDTARSPHNLVDVNLTPNDSVAESVFDDIDILSNGIKIRTSNSTRNANGETYIYAAFAENPFKYSNAR